MAREQEASWQKSLFWLGMAFVNFEGLAGFIVFLLVLTALLLWAVYRYAVIIVPALFVTFCFLAVALALFHAWSKATIQIRARKRIAACLEQIQDLERGHAPRGQILPLEQRLRETAQVLSNLSHARLSRLRRKRNTVQRRRHLRTLSRDCEELRLAYGVVPELSWWSRCLRLHLEWDSVRWLAEHPGPGRLIVLVMLAICTTAVASSVLG